MVISEVYIVVTLKRIYRFVFKFFKDVEEEEMIAETERSRSARISAGDKESK